MAQNATSGTRCHATSAAGRSTIISCQSLANGSELPLNTDGGVRAITPTIRLLSPLISQLQVHMISQEPTIYDLRCLDVHLRMITALAFTVGSH